MKRLILLILYILLVITSILYSIPSFTFENSGKRYFYSSLPSPFNSKNTSDLSLNTPGFTNFYTYTLESNSVYDNPSDWNKIVSSDIKVFEQRLQTLFGSNYEIRAENKENRIFYTIKTPSLISDNQLLVSPNSVFEINSVIADTSTPATSSGEQATTKKKIDLNRADFMYAEYTRDSDPSGNTVYAVRLPFNILITPPKITLAKDNLFSNIKVKTGSQEYSAYFGPYNAQQAPTQLVITGLSTLNEALVVKAFLNTEPLSAGYNIKNVVYETNYIHNFIKLGILILIALVAPVLVYYYFNKKIHWKQILFLLSLFILYVGALKLFDQDITISILILLGLVYSFSIFNLKAVYWIILGVAMLMIKLLGVLNGFDLTWLALINLIGFSFLAWTTIYAQEIDKKYQN